MKQSNFMTKNGTLFHPISKIIEGAKQLVKSDILVVCNNEEIFDEAMVSIYNRFPQATGLVLKPNAGCKMKNRNAQVSIFIDLYGTTVNLHVLTLAEYEADKDTIDAHDYTSKHTVTFCGGNN